MWTIIERKQVREDVPVGYVVGYISGTDRSDNDNLVASNRGLHVTYTLNSLTSDAIDNAFDIDRNTGSLVVARQLDREQQSEYRLEIRALDTSASNNPQSSAVTVKVEIVDVNDNAPKWPIDPIQINVMENSPIGMALYNFTATDIDAGANGHIQYELVQQMPWSTKTFGVDPLTGTLTQLLPIDYEELNEYLLVVKAIDQSVNVTDRLSTLVTARISITDANDNAPTFIAPSENNSVLYLSESAVVGEVVCRVIAIDKDSGNNGRVTYAILSGDENERFEMNEANGAIRLMKAFSNATGEFRYFDDNKRKYTLVISASDHGLPVPLVSKIMVEILVQGSSANPPRFAEPVYHINISENVPIGSFVVRVNATSYQSENGKLVKISKINYSRKLI